jgi:preprotein translocase subunit SecD
MSEYIPRLREELVEAAAREQAGRRHRPLVAPRTIALAAAAAVLVVAVVLAARAVHVPSDEQAVSPAPAGALSYRAVPADAAERAAAALRERIAAVGMDGATVTVAGDRIDVEAEGAARAQVAALAAPGALAIYDWEASVLGPDGRPAPRDASVTGGVDVGMGGSVSHDEAVRRASKAPGGGRVVQGPGGGWFALADDAALDNSCVASAIGMREPGTGDPMVAIELTREGQAAFTSLTRQVANRGADSLRPGENKMEAFQHLAIVFDGTIESLPFIDFQQAPDGFDGRAGVQIQGELTLDRVRQIAAMLSSGPLPATLEPAGP